MWPIPNAGATSDQRLLLTACLLLLLVLLLLFSHVFCSISVRCAADVPDLFPRVTDGPC
jgi:hypothetical protein